MTVFDLVFIFVFFAAAINVIRAAVAGVRRNGERARGILLHLTVGLGIYLAVVVVVSLASPQRVLGIGEPQCADDWCIEVAGVTQTQGTGTVSYDVSLRVFSRARRAPQREHQVRVYLIDDQDRRYLPEGDATDDPFDALLDPGESSFVRQSFTLPADAGSPGLVVARPRFPGMFIIDDNQSLLHRPAIVALH